MLRILTAILIWSSLGVFVRISSLSPSQIILFSSVVSSLCILTLFIVNSEFRRNFPQPGALLPMLFLAPLSLLNTFSFLYAYQNTSIANAVLTHYIAPVLVAFLAPLVLGERLTRRILISVVIASTGLWIMLDMSLVQFTRLLFAGDSNTAGILSGLFSGVCYAVLIILVRIYARQYHPMVITLSQNLLIALCLIPFASTAGIGTDAIWLIVVLGVAHSTIAPALYFSGMKDVSANRAAILGYLEPVAAILLGLLFFKESTHIHTVIGGSMILVSGVMTLRTPHAE